MTSRAAPGGEEETTVDSRRARRATAILLALAATACSTGVRPHLAVPPLALGLSDFHATMEAYGQAPIVGGNRVDILLNGEQIFPVMLDAIHGARASITYAQYTFEEGPVAREVAAALAERCRAGVKVHVLLDGVGSLATPPEYPESMTRAGCHVATFRPLGPFTLRRANNRNHRRILVIDGRIGFTGGSGVSRLWMGNGRIADHWRDTDVRVEGPAVAYLQGAFAENWLEATGTLLGGESYFPRTVPARGRIPVQVVRSSPAGGSFALYTSLLLAMASARRSVLITNPYVLLDDKMTETLERAAGRGARVVLLVPGVIDHPIVRQAGRGRFGRLLEAGIEIFEYQPALLHAKTMVVDGAWATVGSTNLDNRSMALNDELNVMVYDAGVARRLEEVFAEDLRHAKRVDHGEWRRRDLGSRLFELLSLPIRDQL
jgi:cardiolipin synthase